MKGKIKQFKYVGFDVETFGDSNEFYSGGLYWYNDRGEECFEYYTDRFLLIEAMLCRRFRNYTFVATNLGFDLTALFFGTEYWNDIVNTSRGSDILLSTYKLKNNHGKIKIIDTFNFVHYGVAKLGKIIGIDKLEKPSFWIKKDGGDFEAIKPRNSDEDVELEIYNKMDCKISCDFMYFLQKGINEAGGNLKITIASTSMDVWRRSHLKENLTKENFFIPDIKDFIFKGYYGGRTEVFKRGYFEDLNYYDVNSLYPSVMRNDFPLPQSIKKVSTPMISFIKDFEGVCECDVICPSDIKVPLLPVKTSQGKLVFPVGNFRGTYNHCELRKALELGYKLVPLKQVIYTQTFNPFNSYVNTFYNKRLEYKAQGSNMELIYKLLLNSLYGKFAQKEKQKMTIENLDFVSDKRKKELLFGDESVLVKNNHLIDIKKSRFDGLFSIPILSSYTTSYARLLMYDFINRDDCVYTDTDSVVIRGELPTGTELGDMKLEYKVDKGVFVKPKFYLMNDDIKIKGVNRASIDNFNSILRGESVSKIKFSKLRESIRRGINPNTKITVEKNLSLEDNKREWSEDFGNLVKNKSFEVGLPLVMEHLGGVNMTRSEREEFELKADRVARKDYSLLVENYLKSHDYLKTEFKGLLTELRIVMLNSLINGFDLDLIDWLSLDKHNLLESIYDNYKIRCEVV